MDYLPKPRRFLPRLPNALHSLAYNGERTLPVRVKGRLNSMAGEIEQRAWALSGFDALVKRIVQIDQDDDLYLQHLREPFLTGNRLPDRGPWIARWKEIFAGAQKAR